MLANYTGVRFGCQLNKSSSHRPHRLRRSDSAFRRFRRPLRARHTNRTRLIRCTATDRLSFYSVLGVTQDATLAEIKSAFRRLAKQWHPDHNASAAAKSKYQAVKDAFDVLSNQTKRHRYNLYGLDGLNSQYQAPSSAPGSPGPQQHGMQGQNVEAMLALTFMEAALGAERIFQALVRLQCPSCTGSGLSADLQPVDCVACHGTGQSMRCQDTSFGRTRSYGVCPACGGKGVSARFWCKKCGGEGRAETPCQFRVKIPAGVDHGSVLRLNGQGDVGTFGGKRGDIMLRFLVNSEDSFTRRGNDVYSTMPIVYTDAILGTHLVVQTLRGSKSVRIPAGTQHGSTIALYGQGVQTWGAATPTCGIHYLTLHMILPASCGEDELRLLEQLKSLTSA
ncbi:hypothetical protein ABBQ38_010015 [Trebouxia sp. C0009 RCD-2024]